MIINLFKGGYMSPDVQNSNEKLKETAMAYPFRIVRPGGNDTCLIETTMNLSDQDRKLFNDRIMESYPNVEQVGFISLNKPVPRLTMAGGEFCGNATRSTAYQALNGMPGEILISVSGVSTLLKAGVTETKEAFAQMPIIQDPTNIKKDGDNFIVPLEGIIQYIDFDQEKIKGKLPEEIKRNAKKQMEEKALLDNSAVGIMYVKETEKGWTIVPIVWVKSIDTLFYETACGSGTIALTQALAFKNKQSIKDLAVIQPTESIIKASVEFDGKAFGYSQISGPIEQLTTGMIEKNGPLIDITQIKTAEHLERSFNNGLIPLYQETFAAAPYFEKFSDEEVRSFFKQYQQEGLLYLAWSSNRVIGFGAMLPVANALPDEIITQLENAGLNRNYSWYCADLGVDKSFRNKGIGTKLVQTRLDAIKGKTAVMRTSVDNNISQSIYRSLGFQQIPELIQTVEGRRQDGSIKPDTRIFFMKNTV